jgi:hypothetical protein
VTKSIHDSQQFQWQLKLLETADVPFANHSHFKKIWQNSLNVDSLRLSKMGYEWLITCTKVITYKFTLDHAMTNGMLLKLDHLFQSPYYIDGRKNIYVIGEADAIVLQLNGGDLASYLSGLDNQG